MARRNDRKIERQTNRLVERKKSNGQVELWIEKQTKRLYTKRQKDR